MDFNELQNTISQYLILEDKGVVKLLCAIIIANRIPELDPTWVFLVSNSSGGKSELLSALAYARGCWEQDDLTAKTFVSGAKGGSKETSLLYRLPPDPVLIIKDLTLLLDKDPKESSQIFSQLRLIFDGKFYKSFGTGEDVRAVVRMGLIAGTTSAIEDTQSRQASMGMRTMKYYMKQPDRLTVTRVSLRGKRDKEMRQKIGEAFSDFLDKHVQIPLGQELPDLTDQTYEDIAQLSEMATSARSGVKRKEYSRDNPIERKELAEMPMRMGKQLVSLGRAMMIMNGGQLTGLDNRILYQLALDSIPSGRKEVMRWATTARTVTIDGLSANMKLPAESVKIYLEDLVALNVMTRITGYRDKFQYELQENYRQLMSKFENIEQTDKVLDVEEPLPDEPPPLPGQQTPITVSEIPF